MKKTRSRKQTAEKYLYILAKIHEAINSGKNDLKFNQIMKHYRVSNSFKKFIVELNIIENDVKTASIKGSRFHYVWKTREPDYKMAMKVLDEINNYHNKKKAERDAVKEMEERVKNTPTNPFIDEPVETPKEEPKPVVKKVKKDKVEVSLFWGLIKFNMNAK